MSSCGSAPPTSMSSESGASALPEKMSLSSSTLKRNPKMELSRSDLLRLLSILEGELQAREIVIAVLKAEQIKKLLYPPKLAAKTAADSEHHSDPWNALSRDAFGAYDPSFDRNTTLALFNMKMSHLDALVAQQRRARHVLLEQLRVLEAKHAAIVVDQRERVTVTTTDGESETLREELERERSREKQIVLCLLSERRELIVKLIEERQKNEELLQLLGAEKGRVADMVEGLEDESKRSLQMEAELEKYLSEFEGERRKFRNQLSASETRNAELAAEVDRLRQQLNSAPLGEGVRSAIVTMSSSSPQNVPSVSSVSQPRAQHVSAVPASNATAATKHAYATVQPMGAKLNATIPPPPSTPAPSPKALLNSRNNSSNTTLQFQNMTYSLSESKETPETEAKSGQTAAVVQRKVSGRGTPPPIPPNKPVIKPVLPPQALRKDTAKVVQKNAKSMKSTAINSSDNQSTGNEIIREELENFNSLLLSMVSSGGQHNNNVG